MMKTLFGFIKKELVQSLGDRRMRIMLFLMPLVQLGLFGFAISNDIKNIRLVANFAPNDYVLKHIYERSIASGWFIPVQTKEDKPYDLIAGGIADVVLIPPPGGFTKALGREDAQLQILIDSTNVVKAQSIEGYLTNIIQSVVKDDLKLDLPDPPILIEQRVLFNPDLDTSIFMVPGIMCMLLVINTMVLANIAIVREKEMGTFEMLISAPISKSEIIYGKTIPYVILGMLGFPFILAVAIFVFHIPMRGAFWALFLATFVFTCTSVALGSLISTFCRSQQQAMLAGFLFIFPIIMLSGLMFPVENMPNSIKWMAFIDPLYHYVGLVRNIMLKGGGLRYIITHISILMFMAILTVSISFRRFHTTLS